MVFGVFGVGIVMKKQCLVKIFLFLFQLGFVDGYLYLIFHRAPIFIVYG